MKRRTVKTITEYLTPEQLYKLITSKTMTYHTTPKFYHVRDRALMGMAVLSAGRINEILSLQKSQFDTEESARYVVVQNMKISKRKKETVEKYGSHVARRWAFILPLSTDRNVYEYPKLARLVPFSNLVVAHLKQIREDAKLFPFSTRWAYTIINTVTGMFPHWFRAQSEMIYGGILKDSVKLAKFVGVVKVESVLPYVGFDYKEMVKQPQVIK